MRASPRAISRRLLAPVTIALGAVVLWLITDVGFANYDTLYALVWGEQLARGQTPAYGVPIAPTPHPLVEALGFVLSPLSPRGVEDVAVALGFVALSACGWVLWKLGRRSFGAAAGALAVVLFLTRVDVLSYGVRAYVDIPYLFLVLAAVLVEVRRRYAGWPVLLLLAVAGLLRPEAWVFSGLYWLWLFPWKTGREMARLALLVAAAPVLWVASDWLVTGHPLWSLTNTRHTASALDRTTGIGNVPEYIPRRIGEILRPPVLVGAAVGGVLSLLWLRERARLLAWVGVVAVVVFAVFAAFGLPINTRYAFLAAAILCLFCGVGVFGWSLLAYGDPRRRWWMAAGAVVAVLLIAYIPSQYRGVDSQLDSLAVQQRIQDDLIALVSAHAITVGCAPLGVAGHAPIPLLALYLGASPAVAVSAEVRQISRGTYVDPASVAVSKAYALDPKDPHHVLRVPGGFRLTHRNRSWRVYERCG